MKAGAMLFRDWLLQQNADAPVSTIGDIPASA
jgi:hypothetical protein